MREYYSKTQYFATMQLNLLIGGFFKYVSKWGNTDYFSKSSKIYFVTEGECQVSLNGEKHIVKKNQMVVLPKGTVQSYAITEKGILEKYWCHFDATVGGQDFFKALKCDPVIDVPEPEKLTDLFKQMFKEDGENIFSDMALRKAMLFNILSLYLEYSNPKRVDLAGQNIDFSKVFSYMEQNVRKRITVQQMADILHLHPNYYIRVFKQRFGYSPMEFFNKLKTDKAKQFLLIPSESIKSVAEKMGFKDVFSFSKFFKINAGMSPTQYIQMYRCDRLKR